MNHWWLFPPYFSKAPKSLIIPQGLGLEFVRCFDGFRFIDLYERKGRIEIKKGWWVQCKFHPNNSEAWIIVLESLFSPLMISTICMNCMYMNQIPDHLVNVEKRKPEDCPTAEKAYCPICRAMLE